MARKQVSKDSSPRTAFLPRVRCTAAERAFIDKRAAGAGMTESAYLRELALTGRVVTRQAKADFALTHELRRIGVNLNQLARIANSTGGLPDGLAAVLAQVEAALDAVLPE